MLTLAEKYFKTAIITMLNELKGKNRHKKSQQRETIKSFKWNNLELKYVISKTFLL